MPAKTSVFTYQVEPQSSDSRTTLLVSIRKNAAPRKKYGRRTCRRPFGSRRSEAAAKASAIRANTR